MNDQFNVNCIETDIKRIKMLSYYLNMNKYIYGFSLFLSEFQFIISSKVKLCHRYLTFALHNSLAHAP